MMLMAGTFAPCGLLLSRRRGIALVFCAIGVFIVHFSMLWLFTGVLYVQRTAGDASSLFAPVVLLFLTAWLVVLRSGKPARPA